MLPAASALAAPLWAIVTNTVDGGGGSHVGRYTSLALDAAGNPVISYFDDGSGDLRLAHCSDAACAAATINTVDSGAFVGQYTSLALDGAGNPVISYQDVNNGALKLAHCSDPNCAAVTLTTVDGGVFFFTSVGAHTSLALDAAGNPVISHYDSTNDFLKLAHCDDPNCATATINTVDGGGGEFVGSHTSLALDGAGNPVISYYDLGNFDLKLAHCSDVNCVARTLTTVDGGGDNVGQYTSLALDAAGNPVISYYDESNHDLKLAHCSDVNCVARTLTTVDDGSGDNVGQYTSLALDAAGNPVISYWDQSNGALKLAQCDDPNCAVVTLSTLDDDGVGNVGQYTSLALDCAGNPVISYYDESNEDLKLASDDSSGCSVDEEENPPAGSVDEEENPPAGSQAGRQLTFGINNVYDGRLYVIVPASAIPTGYTDCRILAEIVSDSGAHGFGLDDSVWEVQIVCNGEQVTTLLAPITICIRPADGVTGDKHIFHRHTGSAAFSPLLDVAAAGGYVCGTTTQLSLFTLGVDSLPATGFAPKVVTELAGAPVAYVQNDLQLRIPQIGVNTAIVGIPKGEGGWDVSWLGQQAGYLDGSAFPTLAGNTVITAHVWDADGSAGLFARLDELQHGDRFSIRAWDSTYTYEVRDNELVSPASSQPLQHEDYDWVTLITCEGFDEYSGQYRYRRVVRAVLVSVD